MLHYIQIVQRMPTRTAYVILEGQLTSKQQCYMVDIPGEDLEISPISDTVEKPLFGSDCMYMYVYEVMIR